MAVDDEPLALDIIEEYISKTDFLELTGKYTSPMKAMQALKENPVDILFLDIQMPDLSGFDLLESLSFKPSVIFTTAYEDFALESYEVNAVDYLLKPFSFARFLKAINKITSSGIIEPEETGQNSAYPEYLFLNEGGQITRVFPEDIIYIQGYSDYIIVFTENKKHIIRDNLKKVERLLHEHNFLRVHKSFIIPLNRIDSLKGNSIFIGENEIPIGRTYKSRILEEIEKKKLG